jgi:hypothetical protein
MKLSDPYKKEELKNSVYDLKNNLRQAFDAIPEDTFFKKTAIGWSPAENVQHINRVTKLLTLSFSTPKFLASLVFGETGKPAPRIKEVADVYLDALRKGQQSGPFTPKTEKTDGDLPKRKFELLSDWDYCWDKYALALANWDEEQLDKILMPHPFLGKIPAREMYMVGMLHPIHHSEIVSRRLMQEWSYF